MTILPNMFHGLELRKCASQAVHCLSFHFKNQSTSPPHTPQALRTKWSALGLVTTLVCMLRLTEREQSIFLKSMLVFACVSCLAFLVEGFQYLCMIHSSMCKCSYTSNWELLAAPFAHVHKVSCILGIEMIECFPSDLSSAHWAASVGFEKSK